MFGKGRKRLRRKKTARVKMMKQCVLYDRACIECGECDRCDLDPSKVCDNCMRCINGEQKDYRAILIQGVDAPKALSEDSPVKEQKN